MNTEPIDEKTLRIFGLILALAIIFWTLVIYFNNDTPLRDYWFGISVASILFLLAVISPKILGPIYKGWMKVTHILNISITRITLAICFFVIITPVALIKRLTGNDALNGKGKKFIPDSYRQKSRSLNSEEMETPY